MQLMFLVLFGVSLIFFSLIVREAVGIVSLLLAAQQVPLAAIARAILWSALFGAAFVGTGFFLYERERDEGRIAKRIRFYEWILNARRQEQEPNESEPKRIRRA